MFEGHLLSTQKLAHLPRSRARQASASERQVQANSESVHMRTASLHCFVHDSKVAAAEAIAQRERGGVVLGLKRLKQGP